METPYSLATLPRLLDSQHGRSYASPVVELRGSRKRKRNEIVLGLDGDGLSIYSINSQTQPQQATYATPPQSYHCCAPTSVFSAATRTSPARRDTFAVLRQSPRDLSRRLVRYTEWVQQGQEYTQSVKSEHKLPHGNVLAVEPISPASAGSEASPRALITYDDGTLLCVDGHMSTSEVIHGISQQGDSTALLEYAVFVEVATARKGLFRGRGDLLSTLQSLDAESQLLGCFVTNKAQSLSLQTYALTTTPSKLSLRKLDELLLPINNTSPTHSWSLDASSGQLYCLADGFISTLDLTGMTPQPRARIQDRRAPITTFSPLSASTLVALAGRRLTLYDTKYGSDQGSTIIDENAVTFSSRKRKLDDDDYETFPQLCCFPAADTVVVMSKHLLSVQTKAKARSTSLSNVLGQGTTKHLVTITDDPKRNDRQWYEEIDDLVSSSDVAALESTISETFNIDTTSDSSGLWPIGDNSTNFGRGKYRKALVVLERLFTPIQPALDAPARLHLRLISSNLLRWLANAGLLTAEKLTIALGVPVTSADIAAALADPSFGLLQDILSLPIQLPAAFTVECLRLLIRSLDDSPPSSVLAIESTANGHTEELQLEQESKSAEKELTNALTALSSGLETRSEAMRLVFDRVVTIPDTVLVDELRQGLEQPDLLFFIHLLRIELADAGWTARYLDRQDDQSAEEEASPINHAISTITKLMMAAVDAIGTSGWLVGMPDDNDYNLVDALLAEVTVCIEGAYDAQDIHENLNTVQQYATAKNLEVELAPTKKQRGLVEVLSSNAIDDVILPLGGRGSVAPLRDDRKAKAIGGMAGLYQLERIKV